MDTNSIRFNYYSDISEAYRSPGFLYADVPAGFKILTELLNFFETKHYSSKVASYGFNPVFSRIWNLENSPASLNKIIHHDLPMLENPKLTNGYLNLLNMAVRESGLRQESQQVDSLLCPRGFVVYFPLEFKETIELYFEKYGLFEFNCPILLSEQDNTLN